MKFALVLSGIAALLTVLLWGGWQGNDPQVGAVLAMLGIVWLVAALSGLIVGAIGLIKRFDKRSFALLVVLQLVSWSHVAYAMIVG